MRFKSKVKQAGESKWTYRWTFPDGSHLEGGQSQARVQVLHLAGNVALVVTDSKGEPNPVRPDHHRHVDAAAPSRTRCDPVASLRGAVPVSELRR